MAADELFERKLSEVHPFGHEDGRLFSRKARRIRSKDQSAAAAAAGYEWRWRRRRSAWRLMMSSAATPVVSCIDDAEERKPVTAERGPPMKSSPLPLLDNLL